MQQCTPSILTTNVDSDSRAVNFYAIAILPKRSKFSSFVRMIMMDSIILLLELVFAFMLNSVIMAIFVIIDLRARPFDMDDEGEELNRMLDIITFNIL